ncbi:hypothetical protein BRD00_08715 [Halobacteriales archaeon QS_8_69_26]|nr:MAG: hypothetical protein BRD00_08715 [Halobacteriales archaeon QS_8_69_26]
MVVRRLTAARVAVAYAVVGLAWVVLSDPLVAALAPGATPAGAVTDAAFVVVSTGAIFLVVRANRRGLAEARAERDRANRRADVLHRVLRHDVRNTVNVVRGYAELLADGVEDGRREAFAGKIIDGVDDLIETSQQARALAVLTDSEAADPEVMDLASVARDCARQLAAEYPEATVEVNLPEMLRVRAHPWLDEAVRNPLENGIKHNDGAAPEVRVDLEETGPGTVTVAVVDDGPGVPEVEREVLEADTETALVHSTGLGLWITRAAIERSGGDLRIEDREDGTAVVLTLPSPEPGPSPLLPEVELPYPRAA